MTNLTDRQLAMLHAPLDKGRVQFLQGNSHLEQWDVRRHLIRVFGFTGWGVETLELTCVATNSVQNGDRWKHTVVYRAQVRLTIKDTAGNIIGMWEDGAGGDAINQPHLGDAHDLAMKTALSQALKRCAVNLGDQFGLSLYNGGDPRPVVNWSVAYPKPEAIVPDPPVQPDPPVKGEPDATAVDAELDRRIEAAGDLVDPSKLVHPEDLPARTTAQNGQPPDAPRTVAQAVSDADQIQADMDHDDSGDGEDLTMADLLAASISGHHEVKRGAAIVMDRHTATFQQMTDLAQSLNVNLAEQFPQTFGVPISHGTINMFRQAITLMGGTP